MISSALQQKFREEISFFAEKIHAFEAGEIDRNTFKGISGGFGSYAQKTNGYMLRLRLPGGQISKETLRFFCDMIQTHHVNLLKLTTCQTIQMHNLNAASTVSIMRDALDFGIITKGGGGDNPRNVMASPLSGVESGETFDVLPYVKAAGEYLLNKMPDLYMPRKLKVGFSNTPSNETHATFRDLGFIAQKTVLFLFIVPVVWVPTQNLAYGLLIRSLQRNSPTTSVPCFVFSPHMAIISHAQSHGHAIFRIHWELRKFADIFSHLWKRQRKKNRPGQFLTQKKLQKQGMVLFLANGL